MAFLPGLKLLSKLGGRNPGDSEKKEEGSPSGGLMGGGGNYIDKIKTVAQVSRIALAPAIITPIAIVLIFIFFFSDYQTGSALQGGGDEGGSTSTPGTKPNTPAIPGFDIDIQGPPEKENDAILDYTVTITHNPSIAPPLEKIEIYDTLPPGAELVETSGVVKDMNASPHVWPLSDTANQKTFTIKIRPNTTDANFYYTVSARVIGGGGSGGSGNACTEPYEGRGYCSVDNLTKTFTEGGNTALIASMICQGESRSDPFADSLVNLPCPPDYSIGLFQINQLAHCSPAFSDPSACTIGNQTLLTACVTRFKDPTENINYAHQLYLNGGTGWTVNKWGAYANVQKKLQECNIL